MNSICVLRCPHTMSPQSNEKILQTQNSTSSMFPGRCQGFPLLFHTFHFPRPTAPSLGQCLTEGQDGQPQTLLHSPSCSYASCMLPHKICTIPFGCLLSGASY